MEYALRTPLRDDDVRLLRAGDVVRLSGIIFAARDTAHKRFLDALDRGDALPFPVEGAVLYYVGPTPAPPGRPIGSAGPTTSGRMDAYAPRLHALGLKATIGKGKRNAAVKEALQSCNAVYLGATGGVGALLSTHIVRAQVLAYDDLGTEALHELLVEDFPLLVLNDAHGGELFAEPDLLAAGLKTE